MAGLPELLNFVTKFSNLWKSNKSARLAAECHGGKATVSLRKYINHHHLDPVLLALDVGHGVLRHVQKQLLMLLILLQQLWKLPN